MASLSFKVGSINYHRKNYTYGFQDDYEYEYDEEGDFEFIYPIQRYGPMYKDMGTYLVIGPNGITIE